MVRSAFGEFDASDEPQQVGHSLPGIHRESGLAVRIHFPPLTAEEMLTRIATRLRFDHPGLPRVLQYGQTAKRFSNLMAGTPFFITEALDPVGSDAMPKRWSTLRDRMVQLLECMAEAHAYNAFHGAIGYSWLFRQPDVDPPVLRVEGWHIDGTGRIPEALRPRTIAPECAEADRVRPSELVQMDLYGVGYLAWGLTCGKVPRPRQSTETVARFEPQFKVPSGFAQWMQDLLRTRPSDRPLAATIALDHLLEVDRLRRTIPPGSVGKRIPPRPPQSPANGVLAQEVAAALPLLAQRRVPMVGRSELQTELWGDFRQAVDARRMKIAVLRGSAGAGKTRLAEWLFRSGRRGGYADGLQVRHSAEVSPDNGLLGALRRYLQGEGLDNQALLEHCEAWLERAGERRPSIAKLLAALVRDGGGMTPQQRHQTLRSLLRVLADRQPIILWIDDLQWGLDSLEFLLEMVHGAPIPNLFVVCTVRDEALADRQQEVALLDHLLSFQTVQSLHVPALDEQAMTQLTEDHLHLASESASALRARSEGNPLFAIQWVNHAISERLVEWTDHGLMLPPAALNDLPADALRLCGQRIEGTINLLQPDWVESGFKALTAAAVLGSAFDSEEWFSACRLLEFEGAERVLHLSLSRQILVPSGDKFSFSHGLLREAIVHEAEQKGVLGAVREACGNALLEAFDAGRRTVANRLYDLLKNSGHLEDALSPLLVAADLAQTALDLQKTESLLGEAGAICDAMGLAPEAPARIRLRTFQSEVRFNRHDLGTAFDLAKEARHLADAQGLPELAARATLALANATFAQGKLPEALELYRGLINTNAELKSPRHEAQALIGTARVLETLGEVAEAKRQLEGALKLVPASGAQNAQTRAVALRHLAGISQIQGSLGRAQKLLGEALKLENATGNQPALLITMSFMGELCVHLGRPKKARQLCTDAAAGLMALGSDRTHHPLMQLAYLAIAEEDAQGLNKRLEQLNELHQSSHSPRRTLRLQALTLWLSAYHGDWAQWDENASTMGERFGAHSIYNDQFARAIASAALLVGKRGQARRALPMLELAMSILQRLELHDERKQLRERFRLLEKLEQQASR